MDDHELEVLIYRIISGYQYIKLNNAVYKLVSPNIDLKIAANLLYDTIYQENLYSGFILKENLSKLLVETETISSTFDMDIKTTEKTLESAKITYYKDFFLPAKARNKRKIIAINKVLNQAYQKKHSLDFLSLENYCENIKNEFLISKTLYDKNNNLVFEDYRNIDYLLFNEITSCIASNIIDISTYKKIARTDLWRKVYSNSPGNVFDGSPSSYTEEQKALLSVSSMYEKIHEHPEAPSESIIQDDDALDGWMLNQQKEIELNKKQKGVTNTVAKGKGHDELYVMTSAKNRGEIFDMNSPEGLKKIQARTSLKPGETKRDIDFADTRQELISRMQEMQQSNVRK